MTMRKPKRRPIRADTLLELQQLLDRANARDAADTETHPTAKTEK
jgi:hypothetical protein